MDCMEVEELGPLYAGGDLDDDEMARVRQHVVGCARCRGNVEALRASRDWMRAMRGPQLGSDAFEGLRRAVWQKIDERPPRPALLAWLGRSWEWVRLGSAQPALAVAAAFVVVLGTVGGYRHFAPRPGNASAGVVVPEALEVSGAAVVAQDERADGVVAGESGDRMVAQVASRDHAEGGEELGERSDLEPAAGDQLRIEIQTKDPDVRIIWFSPRAESESMEN